MHTEFWCGNLRKRDYLEGLGADGRDWGSGLDQSGSGQGQVAGCCECGNECIGSIKCGEFIDQLRTCYLCTKDT
jgi:hypothetical protein